jgi:hypothetical protein
VAPHMVELLKTGGDVDKVREPAFIVIWGTWTRRAWSLRELE